MPAINTKAIGATSNETPSVPRKFANRLVVLVAFNVADEVRSNATDDAPTPVASTAASTANDVVDLRSPIKNECENRVSAQSQSVRGVIAHTHSEGCLDPPDNTDDQGSHDDDEDDWRELECRSSEILHLLGGIPERSRD